MQLLVTKILQSVKGRIYLFYRLKTFDNVRHDLLLPILQEAGIEKDIRIIHRLY